ncbi:hypothetical protein L604_000700000390 [Bacillus subtilis J27]|nr:hypothetical protein L604_000700000390 [Bacillus subtilis J27]
MTANKKRRPYIWRDDVLWNGLRHVDLQCHHQRSHQMVIGFMVALLFDLLLVGPLAKKIAFRMPFDKTKKIYVILAMSTCMVIGMVLFMSVFGLVTAVLANGLNGDSLFSAYLMIVLKNFILAYPLQLLIMGPLVRGIFMKFVKPKLTAVI